jgi:hypothetical protein
MYLVLYHQDIDMYRYGRHRPNIGIKSNVVTA